MLFSSITIWVYTHVYISNYIFCRYHQVTYQAIQALYIQWCGFPLNDHGFRSQIFPSWKPWSFGSLVLIEAAPRQVHSMFSSILPLQSEYIHTSIYPLYHDQACGPNDYNDHGFQSQSFLSLKPMIIWYSCSQWSKPHLVKYTACSRARPLLFGYILHGVHYYALYRYKVACIKLNIS